MYEVVEPPERYSVYVKNNNGNIALYDCDDTLIFFDKIKGVSPLLLVHEGFTEVVYPNYLEINSLKQQKMRGHYIRVHSQGGQDWAEAVVKLLQLEEYVDSIECKPKWCHDDLPPNEWMTRFYKKPTMENE